MTSLGRLIKLVGRNAAMSRVVAADAARSSVGGAVFVRGLADSPGMVEARKAAELTRLSAEIAQAGAAAAAADAAARKAAAKADAAAGAAVEARRKAIAETDAAARKAAAEADAAEGEAATAKSVALRAKLKLIAILAVFAYVAYDWFTHSDTYVRWRVRKALLNGPPPDILAAEPTVRVLAPDIPMPDRPLVVVGPTGCGKSTSLGKLAREAHARGLPVAFVSFRMPKARQDASIGDDDGAETVGVTLNSAAEQIFRSIGYPVTPALYELWSLRDGMLRPALVKDRFISAITMLMSVCQELRDERARDATVATNDCAPLIIFDELHDLLTKDNIQAGGGVLFHHVASEIVWSSVGRHASRVVLAGSGMELPDALAERTSLDERRFVMQCIDDPSAENVRNALSAAGHGSSDVDAILTECGTRLRHLDPFLRMRAASTGSARVNVQAGGASLSSEVATKLAFLRKAQDRVVTTTLTVGSADEVEVLSALLDKMASVPTTAPSPVTIDDLPKAYATSFPERLLFEDVSGRLSFVSEAVRRAWLRYRSNLPA